MAELLTTAQTADRLGISVPTVNRWAAGGRLPFVQKLEGPRGAYLFDPDVIDALTESKSA